MKKIKPIDKLTPHTKSNGDGDSDGDGITYGCECAARGGPRAYRPACKHCTGKNPVR